MENDFEIPAIEFEQYRSILNLLAYDKKPTETKEQIPFFFASLVCGKYPHLVLSFGINYLFKEFPEEMIRATIITKNTVLLSLAEKYYNTNNLRNKMKDPIVIKGCIFSDTTFLKQYHHCCIQIPLKIETYKNTYQETLNVVKAIIAYEKQKKISVISKDVLEESQSTWNSIRQGYETLIKSNNYMCFLRDQDYIDVLRDTPEAALPLTLNIHNYHPLFNFRLRKIEFADLSWNLKTKDHVEGHVGIVLDLLLLDNDTYLKNSERYKNLFLTKRETYNTNNIFTTEISWIKMRHMLPLIYFHKNFNETILCEIVRRNVKQEYDLYSPNIGQLACYMVSIMERDPFREKEIPQLLTKSFKYFSDVYKESNDVNDNYDQTESDDGKDDVDNSNVDNFDEVVPPEFKNIQFEETNLTPTESKTQAESKTQTESKIQNYDLLNVIFPKRLDQKNRTTNAERSNFETDDDYIESSLTSKLSSEYIEISYDNHSC